MPCLAINVRIWRAAVSVIWIIFYFVVGPHPHDLCLRGFAARHCFDRLSAFTTIRSQRPHQRPVPSRLRRSALLRSTLRFHYDSVAASSPTTCAFAASPLGIASIDSPLSLRFGRSVLTSDLCLPGFAARHCFDRLSAFTTIRSQRPHQRPVPSWLRRSALLRSTLRFHYDSVAASSPATCAFPASPLGIASIDSPLSLRFGRSVLTSDLCLPGFAARHCFDRLSAFTTIRS